MEGWLRKWKLHAVVCRVDNVSPTLHPSLLHFIRNLAKQASHCITAQLN